MFKRPETEEELKLEELDRLALAAEAAKAARKKGHARIALRGKEAFLRESMRLTLTLPTTVDLLGEEGIDVSVASLRKYLMEFLPDDYAAYLQATGRGQKKNRAGATPQQQSSPAPVQRLEQPQQQVVTTPVANPQDAQEKLEQLQMVEREVNATTDDAVAWDLIASRLPWLAEKVKENRVKSYINARMFISSETKSLETSLRLK